MAVINRKSLRVLGINAAISGVVANLPRTGSEHDQGQAPMEYLSFTRHFTYSDADMDTAMRPEQPKTGAALAATRAGRPGCSAGVSQRRSSARFAGQAIQFGWPGFGRAKVAIPGGDPGKVSSLARIGAKPSGHSRYLPKRILQAANLSWPNLQCSKIGKEISAALRLEAGMSRSAARGK